LINNFQLSSSIGLSENISESDLVFVAIAKIKMNGIKNNSAIVANIDDRISLVVFYLQNNI
jgi:hypothetical protein